MLLVDLVAKHLVWLSSQSLTALRNRSSLWWYENICVPGFHYLL